MAVYYNITDAEEHGYRNINISTDGVNVCGQMSLKYMNNTINLSSVECDCEKLKGRCFAEFMKILFHTAQNGELFHQKISDLNTPIDLFVFPSSEFRQGNEIESTRKLKLLYAKYGFVEDKELENYMQSSLQQIIQRGLVQKAGRNNKTSKKRSAKGTKGFRLASASRRNRS